MGEQEVGFLYSLFEGFGARDMFLLAIDAVVVYVAIKIRSMSVSVEDLKEELEGVDATVGKLNARVAKIEGWREGMREAKIE